MSESTHDPSGRDPDGDTPELLADAPDARTEPDVDDVRAADPATAEQDEAYGLRNTPEATTGSDDDPASQLNY